MRWQRPGAWPERTQLGEYCFVLFGSKPEQFKEAAAQISERLEINFAL